MWYWHLCNSFAMLQHVRNCCGITIIINDAHIWYQFWEALTLEDISMLLSVFLYGSATERAHNKYKTCPN